MHKGLHGIPILAGVLAALASTPSVASHEAATTYSIVMVDFAFEPARVTARPGDILQFDQKGEMPHNVEFRRTPPGVDLGDRRMGPYLVQRGETYQIRLDERFKPGTYVFVCTPHETMGMTAQLTVLGPNG